MTLPRLALLSVILLHLPFTSCSQHRSESTGRETTESQLKATIRNNETSRLTRSGNENIQLLKFSKTGQALSVIPGTNYASRELDGRHYRNIQVTVRNNSRNPDAGQQAIAKLKNSAFSPYITVTKPQTAPTAKPDTLSLLINIDPSPKQKTLYGITLTDNSTGIVIGRHSSINGSHTIPYWVEDFLIHDQKKSQTFLKRKYYTILGHKIAIPPHLLTLIYAEWNKGYNVSEFERLPVDATRHSKQRPVFAREIDTGTNRLYSPRQYLHKYTRDYLKKRDGLMERDTTLCFKRLLQITHTRSGLTADSPHNLYPIADGKTYTRLHLTCKRKGNDAAKLLNQARSIIRNEWPGIRIITNGTPSPGDLILDISIKNDPDLMMHRPVNSAPRIVYHLKTQGGNIPWGYAHEPYEKDDDQAPEIHTLRKFLLFMQGRTLSPDLYCETQTLNRTIDWSNYYLFYMQYIDTIKTTRTFIKP